MCAPSVLREENRECDCRFWAILASIGAVAMLGLGIWGVVFLATSLFKPAWTDWAMVVMAGVGAVCCSVIAWSKLADYRDYLRRSRL